MTNEILRYKSHLRDQNQMQYLCESSVLSETTYGLSARSENLLRSERHYQYRIHPIGQ